MNYIRPGAKSIASSIRKKSQPGAIGLAFFEIGPYMISGAVNALFQCASHDARMAISQIIIDERIKHMNQLIEVIEDEFEYMGTSGRRVVMWRNPKSILEDVDYDSARYEGNIPWSGLSGPISERISKALELQKNLKSFESSVDERLIFSRDFPPNPMGEFNPPEKIWDEPLVAARQMASDLFEVYCFTAGYAGKIDRKDTFQIDIDAICEMKSSTPDGPLDRVQTLNGTFSARVVPAYDKFFVNLLELPSEGSGDRYRAISAFEFVYHCLRDPSTWAYRGCTIVDQSTHVSEFAG